MGDRLRALSINPTTKKFAVGARQAAAVKKPLSTRHIQPPKAAKPKR